MYEITEAENRLINSVYEIKNTLEQESSDLILSQTPAKQRKIVEPSNKGVIKRKLKKKKNKYVLEN